MIDTVPVRDVCQTHLEKQLLFCNMTANHFLHFDFLVSRFLESSEANDANESILLRICVYASSRSSESTNVKCLKDRQTTVANESHQ